MYIICLINGDNKATGCDKYVLLDFGKYTSFAVGGGCFALNCKRHTWPHCAVCCANLTVC